MVSYQNGKLVNRLSEFEKRSKLLASLADKLAKAGIANTQSLYEDLGAIVHFGNIGGAMPPAASTPLTVDGETFDIADPKHRWAVAVNTLTNNAGHIVSAFRNRA